MDYTLVAWVYRYLLIHVLYSLVLLMLYCPVWKQWSLGKTLYHDDNLSYYRSVIYSPHLKFSNLILVSTHGLSRTSGVLSDR